MRKPESATSLLGRAHLLIVLDILVSNFVCNQIGQSELGSQYDMSR